VTVIVKASECSDERKTYEATLGHLPVVFTDYTTESDSVKLVERIPNQLIEVRILHLKTIIFIRQIGEYLSVAVRLPRSLVDIESAALYQLCSAGCPAGEILSRKETMKDLPFRPMQQAEQWCSRHNLTGPFYEACFFDFALTGDFDAVLISKEAQQDWERLAPIDSARRPAWTRLGPHFSIEGVRNAGSIFQTKFSIFILMLCWCFFYFWLDC
jgi:RGM domain family member B